MQPIWSLSCPTFFTCLCTTSTVHVSTLFDLKTIIAHARSLQRVVVTLDDSELKKSRKSYNVCFQMALEQENRSQHKVWNPICPYILFPLEPCLSMQFVPPWNPICPYILFPLEPHLSIHCVPPGTLSVHTLCSPWNPVCPYRLFPPRTPSVHRFCSPWNPICPYSLFTLELHLSIHFIPPGTLVCPYILFPLEQCWNRCGIRFLPPPNLPPYVMSVCFGSRSDYLIAQLSNRSFVLAV